MRTRAARFCAIVALSAPAHAAGPAADTTVGTIQGRVRLFGGHPTSEPIPVTRDPAVCGTSQPDERLVVGADRGLGGVAVYLQGADLLASPPPARVVELVIAGCRFHPHVQVAVVGQELAIRNDDPLPHRIQAFSNREESLFQLDLTLQHQVVRERMKRRGVVHIQCADGHLWASATVVVLPHSHGTVTDADGSFELADVPAGSYTLVAWQEMLGTERQPIVVRPGAGTSVEITYQHD